MFRIPKPRLTVMTGALCLLASGAFANPFAQGWDLRPEGSALRFQSVKNNAVVETSSFATFAGTIDESGRATLRVLLDSVDTQVDLRNVRMRFLFFETFQFPEALVTLDIDPALIEDLPQVRRKIVTLPYLIDLHGVTQQREAQVAITLLSDDLVSVSSFEPVSLKTDDFNLAGGIQKLEEAAGVKIVPSSSVTFDLLFARRTPGSLKPVAAAPIEEVKPASVALEAEGNFDQEACVGRFEILSRTDNIYFRSGSARLDGRSAPLLDSIVDIVNRCPGLRIEVSGHTDSDGSDAVNQRLSQARAQAVAEYLTGKGADGARIETIGYGETRPAFPNDSAENKRRNRRIEFTVTGS